MLPVRELSNVMRCLALSVLSDVVVPACVTLDLVAGKAFRRGDVQDKMELIRDGSGNFLTKARARIIRDG